MIDKERGPRAGLPKNKINLYKRANTKHRGK